LYCLSVEFESQSTSEWIKLLSRSTFCRILTSKLTGANMFDVWMRTDSKQLELELE